MNDLEPTDSVKIMEKRNQFMDILLNVQKKYLTDSLEYQSIKLAIVAITFYMELHVDRIKKKLTERQHQKIVEVENLMQQEYNYLFNEENTESDILLEDIPRMITCLKGLLKLEKGREISAALECSLKDIDVAMEQETRFCEFLKSIC